MSCFSVSIQAPGLGSQRRAALARTDGDHGRSHARAERREYRQRVLRRLRERVAQGASHKGRSARAGHHDSQHAGEKAAFAAGCRGQALRPGSSTDRRT